MKFFIVSILFFCCATFLFYCSTPQSDGQMEITTASAEAKKLFLKAREKNDNIEFLAAVKLFDQAIEKDPNLAMAYLYRALRTSDRDKSWKFMDKAVSLTDQVSAGEAEFIFYYQATFNGEGPNQKKHLDKLEQLHPNDRNVLYQLGVYYYQALNDYNKALTYFNKVTEFAPDYGPTYNMIGYCNIELENYDAAEVALKKYIELTPDSPNPYDSYAELLLTLGKYDQSIEHYQKAYDKNNDFTTALTGIGNNYAMKGDFEKAREYYKRVHDETARTNQKFGSLTSIIASYVEEGNIDKAIEVCEKRFELAKDQELPDYQIGSLNTAGFILCESDKIVEAKMYYDRAAKAGIH